MYLSFLSGLHLCLGRGCGFPQPGVSQKYTQKYTQSIPRSIPEARHDEEGHDKLFEICFRSVLFRQNF